MNHAIEKAAQVMDKNFNPDRYPVMAAMFRDYARALAAAGLLAPAPLREEWAVQWVRRGGEIRTYPCDDEADARDCADDEITVHQYVSDWMPVDRAEGDGALDVDDEPLRKATGARIVEDEGWPDECAEGDGSADQ